MLLAAAGETTALAAKTAVEMAGLDLAAAKAAEVEIVAEREVETAGVDVAAAKAAEVEMEAAVDSAVDSAVAVATNHDNPIAGHLRCCHSPRPAQK